MHVTRFLGLRYFWINSLCIMQDDEEDWMAQAGKMADIYAGAHLTVAAVHADGPEGGLFSTLGPEMRAHRLSVPSTDEEDEPKIFARRGVPHLDYRYLNILTAASPATASKFPLLRRAWFLQEWFISQRVLHFTSSELTWQCFAHTACQCRGSHDDGPPLKSKDPKDVNLVGRHYHTAALTSALRDKGKENVARRWLLLVDDYSLLDMTFERDVFPALSGLAKVFGRLLETQYRAGIWEGFILPGLLWHTVRYERKKWGSRPREWRAPSWSWASVGSAVSFISVGEMLNPCQIVSVECPLRGSDATGEVVGGEMVVRGLLFPAKVRHRADYVYELDFMDGAISGTSYADYDWAVDGPGNVEDGAAVRCLLVGVQAEEGKCYLLVLKESAPSERTLVGRLERIGLVEISGNKVERVSTDGTVHMVSPYEVIWRRSEEQTVRLV